MAYRSLLGLPLLAVLAVLGGAAPAAAACAHADVPLVPGGEVRAAAAVRCLVDVERAARGLPALENEPRLALAGTWHASDMLKRDFFAHDAPAPAPYGVDAGDRLTKAGYAWWGWGENIAAGYKTPLWVMEGWMRSDGHCRNVLSPRVTQLGVGVVAGEHPQWVQVFGLPDGSDRPTDEINLDAECPAAGVTTAGAPRVAGSATPTPAAPAATAAAPAAAPDTAAWPTISFSMRQVGRRVRVNGTATGGLRRVKVTVRRGRRARSQMIRVRSGSFRALLRAPAGRGRLRVTVASVS